MTIMISLVAERSERPWLVRRKARMKILLINGSPHERGATSVGLSEVAGADEAGIPRPAPEVPHAWTDFIR
jgi:hypothetical protein